MTCSPRRTEVVVASLLVVFLGLGAMAGGGTSDGPSTGGPSERAWQAADPAYVWAFPRDHHAHPRYRTEWWYFTGNLTSPEGRRFGYQFTLFRIGLSPDSLPLASDWASSNLVMGHASISDLDRHEHRFSELLYRATPFLGGFPPEGSPLLAWSRAPVGTDGRWSVRWNGNGFDFTMRDDAQRIAFDLHTTATKPLVYQGPNGFSRKGDAPDAASQYYSFTRLATEGQLALDGVDHTVSGSSWMDKEFGSNQLAPNQVGWDWFSLQLDDGRDLMLYRLRSSVEPGPVRDDDFTRGTVIAQDGSVRYLAPADWTLSHTDTWLSPRTNARYPMGWEIEIPSEGVALTVTPTMKAQENVGSLSGGIYYWEGAVVVRGVNEIGERTGQSPIVVGRGYVELTGYGQGNRPPI